MKTTTRLRRPHCQIDLINYLSKLLELITLYANQKTNLNCIIQAPRMNCVWDFPATEKLLQNQANAKKLYLTDQFDSQNPNLSKCHCD